MVALKVGPVRLVQVIPSVLVCIWLAPRVNASSPASSFAPWGTMLAVIAGVLAVQVVPLVDESKSKVDELFWKPATMTELFDANEQDAPAPVLVALFRAVHVRPSVDDAKVPVDVEASAPATQMLWDGHQRGE